MSRLEDLTGQLKRREAHTFCKELLSVRRKEYKCAQNRITANPDSAGYWHIYIDPEGYVGAYKECCRWSAMVKALDDKFGEEERYD